MTPSENSFQEENPADYRLFAVRYLILPAHSTPSVGAHLTLRSGRYWLWTIAGNGYIQAGTVVGTISANRTNIGLRSVPLLRSSLAEQGAYLGVRYGVGGGSAHATPQLTGKATPGTVSSQRADLANGDATATLAMRQAGVAVLSASYDPGWTATVNGQPAETRMLAPALVGVDIPAGTDHVVFRFRGYRHYPELLGVGALTLIALAALTLWRRRARRARRVTQG